MCALVYLILLLAGGLNHVRGQQGKFNTCRKKATNLIKPYTNVFS